MTEFKPKWCDWEVETPNHGTDKTDKRASVSFVSSLPGHIQGKNDGAGGGVGGRDPEKKTPETSKLRTDKTDKRPSGSVDAPIAGRHCAVCGALESALATHEVVGLWKASRSVREIDCECLCLGGLQRGDESIPATVDRLDYPLLRAIIANRLTRNRDAARQNRLGDRIAGPDVVENLRFRDQAIAVLDQEAKHVEYLRLDPDDSPCLPELVELCIQDTVAKGPFHVPTIAVGSVGGASYFCA